MNIRIFDGRYNATAPLFTYVFSLRVPAGRICKMGRVLKSDHVTTVYRCGKRCLKFHQTFFHSRGS